MKDSSREEALKQILVMTNQTTPWRPTITRNRKVTRNLKTTTPKRTRTATKKATAMLRTAAYLTQPPISWML